LLARRLEQELTKEEILHLYVNHINFGHGRYGVQEAARFYFGKDVEELTLAEASLLAGIPQSPTRLSPRSHPDAARRRQRFVLDQLADKREAHWPEITPAQIEEARSAEIALVSSSETRERAPEIVAMARAVLEGRVSETAFARGGFTIHTTIDIEAQDAARQALRTGLEALDQRRENLGPLEAPRRNARIRAVSELELGATYDARVTGANESELELDVGGHTARASIPARFNPRELSPSAFAEEGARVRISVRELPEGGPALVDLELGAQAAIVVIEPRSREILAMVGGYDSAYGFNRAVQARRQPGSTFKPIVYALAIKNRRLTPASMLLDAPTVYADGYRPSDFQTHRYRGLVRVREALADSLNACAINAIDAVGVDETIVFARSLGIESPLEPVPSLALGTSEVSVLELTNAYATFAAGGRFEEARWLDHIEGPDGARIAGDRDRTARDVLSAAEAHVVTSLLRSVVETGTAHEARSLNRPAAGKTGTSDDARDAWFVGYTPDLVAGVWVGFDDRRPLGRRESGAKAALPIWIGAMRRLSANRRSVDFPTPSGTVVARIDPASGLLAYEGMQEPLEEVFLEGTAPTEVARSPDIADPDSFLMDQIGDPTLPAGERAPGTTP
jgi:penicillin-binding protein 1A